MTCCPTIRESFANVEVSSIPYGLDRQAQNGRLPFVQVVYFIDGEYIISNNSSAAKYVNGNVLINHGGPASGFVLIK